MSKPKFQILQEFFAARLNSLAFFSDITVKALRDAKGADGKVQSVGDIQNDLDKALAGLVKKGEKAGVAVCVLMPTINLREANVPGPQQAVFLECLVQEIPVINMGANGTKKSAEEVAEVVAGAGHFFRMAGICQGLRGAKGLITPDLSFAPKLTYRVLFEANLDVTPRVKAAAPGVAIVAGTCTITNRESGATVYYTVGDGDVFPGSVAGTVYSVPFAVAAGKVVLAAAYVTGKDGSDIERAES